MGAHVLIVEFGGLWFQTTSLTWQQWLWCLGFGVSELLWAQVCAVQVMHTHVRAGHHDTVAEAAAQVAEVRSRAADRRRTERVRCDVGRSGPAEHRPRERA